MTSEHLADAIHRIATTDDVRALARLADAIRREHPGDREAATVARAAELKRQRLIGAS